MSGIRLIRSLVIRPFGCGVSQCKQSKLFARPTSAVAPLPESPSSICHHIVQLFFFLSLHAIDRIETFNTGNIVAMQSEKSSDT